MKFSAIIFLLAIAALGFTSCQKEEGAKGIAGTWVGKWGFGLETPSNTEKWVIEKNGDLTAYDDDGSLYASGTWSVDGVSFQAEYTPVGKSYSYSFSGLYGAGLEEIIGNWGETPSNTDGGTFEMYKE